MLFFQISVLALSVTEVVRISALTMTQDHFSAPADVADFCNLITALACFHLSATSTFILGLTSLIMKQLILQDLLRNGRYEQSFVNCNDVKVKLLYSY